MRPGANWLEVGKTVFRLTRQSNVGYLATALAYYGFVSVVPVLVLVVAVVGWQAAGSISVQPAKFVTPGTQQLLAESLATASGRTGSVVLSVGVLAWSSANVATGFLTAVERIEAVTGRSLAGQVRDAVVVLGTLSIAMGVIFVQMVLLAVVSGGLFEIFLGAVVLLAVLTVAFLPLYVVPSQVVDSVSEGLPGALTAACGWSLLSVVVQLYAVNAVQYAIYGVLSGIILLLTGLYVAATLLMIGIVVNVVVNADSETDTDTAELVTTSV